MSETVKRYDMCCDYDGWDDRVIERESPDGDWVRHTDYAALAQQLADVAYLAEWWRYDDGTDNVRGVRPTDPLDPESDFDAYAFGDEERIVASAPTLPALGALLRQREVG